MTTATTTRPTLPAVNAGDFLAVDDLLTDDERAVRDSVAKFVDKEVRPVIVESFDKGRFPKEIIPGLGELGILGMHLHGYGCAGASAAAYGVAARECEAGDSAIRSFVSVQGSLVMFPIRAYGSEEQKERWLPLLSAGEAVGCFGLTEPDAGSDPGAMKTTARKDGSDWILNGTKMWITNGAISDVAVVWASTDEGITGFLVEKGMKGFSTSDVSHKLSLRASVTSELHFDDVRLPDSSRLPGVHGLKGPLSCLSEARYGIAWGVVGAARDSLLCALDYTGSRKAFGSPLSSFQITQQKIAQMATDLTTSSLMAWRLARLKEKDQLRPDQVSMAKRHNVRSAINVARAARTLLGANGITGEYSPMRHMANLESVLTYEGTEEVHALVVGQALTGHNAFGRPQ